jgi:hypothetical protein
MAEIKAVLDYVRPPAHSSQRVGHARGFAASSLPSPRRRSWSVLLARPVAFEFVVMFASLITSPAALFAPTHRWPGRGKPSLPGVTDDRFALALVQTDAAVDLEEQMRMPRAYGVIAVAEGDELA